MMIAKETLAARTEELKGHVDQLGELISRAVEHQTPVHQLEEETFQVLLDLGRQTLQVLFDVLGTGDVGETYELPDGRSVKRLEGLHVKPYLSIFGEFKLPRCVYGRGEKSKIDLIPLDARLALPENKFSYLLQSWDQSLAMEAPFDESRTVIQRILGIGQHVDSLERMNRDMSKTVSDFHLEQSVPPAAEEGAIVVQTADGKGVPIRRPADAPPIHEHRSKSGPKKDRKKMAVLGAVYSIDPHMRTAEGVVDSLFRQPGTPKTSSVRPQPKHKRIRAYLNHTTEDGDWIGAPAAVFGWMADEVAARNPGNEKPVVCIMDGQESLWDQRDIFQADVEMVDVLDLLHVTPRLWEAAHLFHKPGSCEATQFVRHRVLRILHGEVSSVIRGLRCLATKHKLTVKNREKLETICNYFVKNRNRMRYDVYLRRGFPIASGVIEGACRHVVKDRMERTGMTWTVPGAQAMLKLRCVYLSKLWSDFTNYRVEHETERLYPYREALGESSWALAP